MFLIFIKVWPKYGINNITLHPSSSIYLAIINVSTISVAMMTLTVTKWLL